MPSDRFLDLVTQAVNRDPNDPSPLRPQKIYEDILVRDITIGMQCGTQDIRLFPEDELVIDPDTRDIDVYFKTIGNGNGMVSFARAFIQFFSYSESKQQREKGTLRPDPEKLLREFHETQEREQAERVATRIREVKEQEE